MRLLTIAASFREESYNRQLIDIASNIAQNAGATITPVDYASTATLPLLCDAGHPPDTIPEPVRAFATQLSTHDGFMLSSPEYNWSIPGALKNLIDWLSVLPEKPLNGKKALLLSATPSVRGGIIGLGHLCDTLMHLGVYAYPHRIGIGQAEQTIQNGTITHPNDAAFLQNSVEQFIKQW